MASIVIRERKTKDGEHRYLIQLRVGGRDTRTRNGGS
jgi:hypothetical protein